MGTNCVKDSDGKIVVEEDRLMEVWRAHYDVLSNEELTWDREGLTDVSPVCGPSERISTLEKDGAIGKMNQGKSGGPTGVVAKNKEIWMAFVDLQIAYDRVPREVVWWALRYLVTPKNLKTLYNCIMQVTTLLYRHS